MQMKIFFLECGADEFTCMTNGQCIPLTTKCDQRIDCSDGSDEKACRMSLMFYSLIHLSSAFFVSPIK